MSGFPLNINGAVFSSLTLGKHRYVQNYPDLLAAVTAHTEDPGMQLTASFVLVKRLFPSLRVYTFYVRTNLGFQSGMPVLVVAGFGEIHGLYPTMYGFIETYDISTGKITVRVDGYEHSVFLPGTVYITALVMQQIPKPAVAAVAEGGTGATKITGGASSAAANCLISYPDNQLSLIFDDFSLWVNNWSSGAHAYPYTVVDITGAARFTQDSTDYLYTSNVDLYDRAGMLLLAVTATSENIILSRGPGALHCTGGTMTFRTSVLIPTLSAPGDEFKLFVGLRGAGSSIANIFSHAGLGFTYTDSENSGRWVARYGANGSVTTSNLAPSVTADTWYDLEIETNATNLIFRVNGATLLTVAVSGAPSSGLLNLVSPAVQLTKIDGTFNESGVFVDYFYCRKLISRS